MAYRPHGHASANPQSPSAWGRCDRCGFIYNHRALQFQFDYRGPRLTNLRFLVCQTCYDKPQAQLKPIMVTQDPLPIINARPEDYNYANTGAISEPGSITDATTGIPVPTDFEIVTEDGKNITVQPLGKPADMDPNAIMPLFGTQAYDVVLPVLSVTANGSNTISVTTSSAHGLVTDSQISASGLTNNDACGFYSVVYVSATVFTYNAPKPISSGGLLGAYSRIVTALVGIPPQYTQIPQVGS